MSNFKNILNHKFGMLTVIRKTDKNASNGEVIWECKCSCENETIVYAMGGNLRKGFKNTCGCIYDPESPEYWKRTKIRIEKKAKFEGDCLIWKASKNGNGYGQIFIKHKGFSRPIVASRAVWIANNGKIPQGYFICHSCDNPACIRLDHLFLGTQKDNIDDCIKKKRNSYGEKNHMSKLTEIQAKEIKNLKNTGKNIKELCEKYNVKPACIKHIWAGTRWKHI